MMDGNYYCGDTELILDAADVPHAPYHLCVTSPPYYNAREGYAVYGDVDVFFHEMRKIFRLLKKHMAVGGRVCINTSTGYGRKEYIHLGAKWIDMMLSLGYTMRGEIIWDKGASSNLGKSWGSWLMPSTPHLRDVHEAIYVFNANETRLDGDKEGSDLTKDEFLLWTKSIWAMQSSSSSRIGHPAPMPMEMAERLVRLYSFKGNTVIDPFCGSGTTIIAALKYGRVGVGIDRSEEYIELAKKRTGEAFASPVLFDIS